MYFFYTLLILCFGVIASPYLAYQAIRYRKYVGSLGQRMGYLPVSFNLDAEESIWIHAVSVGEVLTARALIPELRRRYPNLRLFVSTTTMVGQEVARRNVHMVDAIFYFPFDLPFIVRRTLNLVRPRLFIMMETEIWPNLLHACRKRGVKTMMVNGRISPRSYPRYRLVRPLFRRVLAEIDRFCVQSEKSAQRLVALGADPDRIVVSGNLKFDSVDKPGGSVAARAHDRVLRFFRIRPGRPVIVAGSTMEGEEEPLLEAFRRIRSATDNPLLVLAPRNPERFSDVAHLARDAALVTVRRSELPIDAEPRADVVVLDTIGELARLYQVATAVFVGGSLVNEGGHNILEPAVFGKAIVFGPHMQNFAEIAETFLSSGAAVQVRSPRELEQVLLSLLTDPVRRAGLGAAARTLVESNRGARDRTLAVIARLLPERGVETGVVRPFYVVH
jgi:3-deoxy-D-manno-octulosonic-acid transferase